MTNQTNPAGIKEVYETTDADKVNSYLKNHWMLLTQHPNDNGKTVYVLGCLPEGVTRRARTKSEMESEN